MLVSPQVYRDTNIHHMLAEIHHLMHYINLTIRSKFIDGSSASPGLTIVLGRSTYRRPHSRRLRVTAVNGDLA